MFKKFLSLSLVFVMMFAMSSSIFADDSIENNEKAENTIEQKKFDIDNIAPVIGEFEYDAEYAKKVAQKEQLAERYYQAKLSKDTELASKLLSELDRFEMKSTNLSKKTLNERKSKKYLSIWQVDQSTNYYCGYAAIKSLLDYEGVSKTQDEIAGEVYSTNNSCPWYLANGNSYDQFPVPKYLSDQIDFFYVPYPYGAAGTTNITTSQVKSRVVATIDNEHGLMACGKSKGSIPNHESILPGYPAYNVGHWIVIRGYNNNGNTVRIADPAKSDAVSFSDNIDAYYSISTSKLRAFIQPRGLVW